MLSTFRSKNKRMKILWWSLAIVTIVTFVGGFVFVLGSGFATGFSGEGANAVGTVNGRPIGREEYLGALNDQREQYRSQYGVEPAERDIKIVELQTWRNLVNNAILEQNAKQLGLKAYDPEVVLTLRTSPPQRLLNAPAFQTDGQFDANKYTQALQDPSLNWAPFEELVRQQIPIRKLQERLLASIKLSEPELRTAHRDQYETVSGTVLQILPTFDQANVEVTDADIDRVYAANKGRFAQPRRAQVEVLLVPKRFGDIETQAARDLANSLVQRARQGEDFAVLARDYSEGPGAENGGVVERWFTPREFGPEMAPLVQSLQPGGVTDPLQDGSRFMIFQLLERNAAIPDPAVATVKVAQIIVKVRPDANTLREQYTELTKLRKRAASGGLSRAATEIGSVTATTDFFGYNNPPPALFTAPEAADWALAAKTGEVSQVFEGIDEWAIVQVAALREAGPAPREDVIDQLRQIAEVEKRVQGVKPKADQAAAELAQGRSLEQAAQSLGIAPIEVRDMTRQRPDPRVGSIPDVMGALFAAPEGRVTGPIEGLNGWYFTRVDNRTAAHPDSFAVRRAQLSSEILQRRQQSFLVGLALSLREEANVEDKRLGR